MNKSHSIRKKHVNKRIRNANDHDDSAKQFRNSKFFSGKMRRYSKSSKFNKLNTTTENRQDPNPVKLRFNPMMYNRSKVSSFGLRKDQKSQNTNLKSNKMYGKLGKFRRTSSINEILSDDSEVMPKSPNPSNKMPPVDTNINLSLAKATSMDKTRNQTFNTDRSH